MTLSIKTVKREIRILGLDTCGKQVFGAIVRGGFFLDGVVLLSLPGEHDDREVASVILATRYYPELRAIMLHDPGHRVDGAALEKLASLPVMEVVTTKQGRKGYDSCHSSHGTLWYLSRLPCKTVESILSLTWTTGRLPEPARIAHLLARTRLGSFPLQKAQNEPVSRV